MSKEPSVPHDPVARRVEQARVQAELDRRAERRAKEADAARTDQPGDTPR